MMRLILTLCLLGSVLSDDPLKTKANIPGVKKVKYSIGQGNQICDLDVLAKTVGLPLYFSLEEGNQFALGANRAKARLIVRYKGVEAREFTLQATKNSNGCYEGLVTGYYPTINNAVDTSSTQSDNDLRKALADYVNLEPNDQGPVKASDVSDFAAKKVIYVNPVTGAASLAYEAKGVIELLRFFRNVRIVFGASLDVIAVENRVRYASSESSSSESEEDQGSCPNLTGGNQKIGVVNYGSGANQICIGLRRKGNKCTLRHDNFVVKTLDNTKDPSKARDVTFDCDVGPNDATNGAFSPCLDAFNAARETFDLLNDLEQVPKIKRNKRLNIWCHFGQTYPNSFFDGKSIALGDGSASVFPFSSSPDVVSHEIGHYISAQSGVLQFTDQSLAIDEAFGDITGRAVAAYTKRVPDNNWKFGEALIKQDGVSLRDFQNPEVDGFTIKHVEDYSLVQKPSQASGIVTKAFEQIVTASNLNHVGVYKAFLLAIKIYFTQEVTLLESALSVTRAAQDLGLDTAPFVAGFNNVGLDVTSYL